MSKDKLDAIADAIEAIKNGEVIIVVDDDNRENEGDFVAAAEKITPEMINFHGYPWSGFNLRSIDRKALCRIESSSHGR